MLTHDSSPYVVVGAGLAGAATAWRLAEAGHDVTVVERGSPADRAGSSHGSARILRYSYPEPFYTDLVLRSRPLWTELEEVTSRQLITRTGCLDWGELRDPSGLSRVLEHSGIEHELLNAEAASERWPIEFETPVLWHPDAGVIDAEATVMAMIDLATSHGARVMTGWDLESLERAPVGGYRLRSASGAVLDARHVIICAGGFLPHLLQHTHLPRGLAAAWPTVTVTQEQAHHFRYRDDSTPWPTFIHKTRAIQTYSLPGGRDAGHRGQKLAEYAAGRRLRSAREQDHRIDPSNRDRLVDYVATTLPGLHPEPYAETTCLFTSTPSTDFVLDRMDDVTVISPCSGHGAKFAPLVGVLGAHLASAPTPAQGRTAIPRRFLLDQRPVASSLDGATA